MRNRLVFGIVALATALGTAGQAAAQEPQLPLGESKGVRLVRDAEGSLVWVFTREADRLHQRVRGKRVYVSCTDLPEVRHLGGDVTGEGTQYERVPRRGRRLRTGDLTGWDYCRLFLPRRVVKRHGHKVSIDRRHLVTIPLTQTGAVQVDGERKNLRLVVALLAIGGIADERRLTTWPLFDDLPEKLRAGARLTSLANPQDAPPPGMLGYYSDGQQHIAIAILTATGTRLFFEREAGDVIHSNTSRYGLPTYD